MNARRDIVITLPADAQQVDQTGYVWAFLDAADEPKRVQPGALIVAGDVDEPFLVRVVDIVTGPDDRSIVHLDIVGVPTRPSTSSATPACFQADRWFGGGATRAVRIGQPSGGVQAPNRPVDGLPL
jgi:hypothetical protein